MDNITHLSSAPVGVHAFFVGERPGEVRSEPIVAVAMSTNRDASSLSAQRVRVMVMAEVGSDELTYPGDLEGFLGVGRLQDQAFWESESEEWFAAQKREQRQKRRKQAKVVKTVKAR